MLNPITEPLNNKVAICKLKVSGASLLTRFQSRPMFTESHRVLMKFFFYLVYPFLPPNPPFPHFSLRRLLNLLGPCFLYSVIAIKLIRENIIAKLKFKTWRNTLNPSSRSQIKILKTAIPPPCKHDVTYLWRRNCE